MTTKEKADYAEIELEVRIRARVWADGRTEITRMNDYVFPTSLTRRLSKRELAEDAKHDNEYGGNEWWQGGVAILDAKHAPNGRALVSRAEEFGAALRSAIRKAVATDESSR